MNVWRIQAKIDTEDKSSDFIKEGKVGVGLWDLWENHFCGLNSKEIIEAESTINDYQSFLDYLKGKNIDKVNTCIHAFIEEIEVGDYIWMRNKGKYYISKIEENNKWFFSLTDSSNVQNLRNNIKWLLVGDESSVPGIISTSFIRGRTLQKINNKNAENYSKYVYEHACNHDFKLNLEFNENTFFEMLQPSDLEDLMALYLFNEKGLVCIPSTNKISTPLYECVLVNPSSGKKSYIQAKNGNADINIEEYKNLDGDVYLTTTKGNLEDKYDTLKIDNSLSEIRYICKSNNGEIYCIPSNIIFEFAKNNNNQHLIPDGIKTWLNTLNYNSNCGN